MKVESKNRPESLEDDLRRLAPWGHYFKFDEKTITGFFASLVSAEKAVNSPEETYITNCDPEDKIKRFSDAYTAMMENSKRQYMLIDVLKRIMGSDFYTASAYDFACNDGMKSFYLKKAGIRNVTGYEYREDCIARANYINELGEYGCDFVHYPISADTEQFGEDLDPVDIVCSFGLLHHLIDHEQHLKSLYRLTKRVLLIHCAFTGEKSKNVVLQEKDVENSFKSVLGRRALTTKPAILEMLYNVGFSYVLDIVDDTKIDQKGFGKYSTYLVAVV